VKESIFLKKLEDLDIKHFISGQNVMLSCPFHDDYHPSLGANFHKNKYNCFSCGAHGTLVELFKALFEGKKEEVYLDKEEIIKGSDWPEQIREKLKILRLSGEKQLMIKVLVNFDLDDFKFPFGNSLLKDYEHYLVDRKISVIEANKWKIKCGLWRGAPRIIVPMYDEYKRLVSIYGRSITDEKHLRIRKSKGADVGKILFGLEHLKYKRVGVLVEGEFDAIYLQKFGIPAVAIGTKKPTKVQLMKMSSKFKRVCLSLDGDTEIKECRYIARIIKDYLPVKILYLPNDKDPNELDTKEVKEIYKNY